MIVSEPDYSLQDSEASHTRIEQSILSFRGEPLLRERNKIHPYPAMLHPLLVDFLIDRYAKNGNTIFDPFAEAE